jgi:hypothetical protein
MLNTFAGIFVILHGLVHLWYVVLSYQVVEFQPDMGWTGKSWFFSAFLQESSVRQLAGILFIIAALLFIISGIGIITNAGWLSSVILISSIFSSIILILFWDGSMAMIVQKGIIGVIINLVLIAIYAL